MLGYKFWIRQFNGDATVVGRKLRLNDKVRTVVGVMPKRFMFRGADVYLPVVPQRGKFIEDVHYLAIMGRLRPGTGKAAAEAELRPVLQDLITREEGEHPAKLTVVVQDFYETFPSGIRQSLWILFGAVGVLMLIACANVSSLLLSRSTARGREMAIRLSLGAGRFRIARQLLTESAIIGIGAGAVGILLAFASLRSMLAIVPPDTIPDESEVTLNSAVLLFTLAVSLAAALLFGLAPALQAARAGIAGSLKQSGRGISGAFGEARIRNILVIVEVALAMVLLVSASLVIRTLLHVERVQVGAQPENILTMTIPLPDKRYPTREARNAFYLDLLDRIRQVPGLTEIALNQSVHPFVYFGTRVRVPGSAVEAKTTAIVSQVNDRYTEMVNIHLLQGRLLTESDIRGTRKLALVNRKFAAFFFPNRDPIGRTVQLLQLRPPPSAAPNETCEIVGVVSDLPNVGLKRETRPEVYIPFTLTGYLDLSATLLAKGGVAPANLIRPIEAQIHQIDRDQPVMEVRTLREWLDLRGYSEPRFSVFLFGIFAGLGLLLAALGIYAVISYSVLRQTQEIGVRMALGAQRPAILKMIAGSGARLLAMGIALGFVSSLAVGYLLRSMIWGISPFDPLSFCAVVIILFAIGLLACLRPALRAARIDPMMALRYE